MSVVTRAQTAKELLEGSINYSALFDYCFALAAFAAACGLIVMIWQMWDEIKK